MNLKGIILNRFLSEQPIKDIFKFKKNYIVRITLIMIDQYRNQNSKAFSILVDKKAFWAEKSIINFSGNATE